MTPELVKPKKGGKPGKREPEWFWILSIVALALQGGLIFLALFPPGLAYMVSNPRGDALDSDQFRRTLASLTMAQFGEGTKLDVLTNGENYYPAELDAIRNARSNIHVEAYIFTKGEVTKRFLAAMEERARAGVKVRLIADAVGSHSLPGDAIKSFKDAGGIFAWYTPLRWYTWPRMNNRTHRELLIVDGRIGFVGGSGWADHWLFEDKGKPRWRDTMVKVQGPSVTGLQAVFSENWMESHGEVLSGRDIFPFEPGTGTSMALVVRSSPTTGRSTPARVLVQTLVAAARKRIYIETPYFLPDDSLSDEIVRAVRNRGVEVKIITPGPGTDHMLTRRSSRRKFGPLLQAGARIYEYQPTMIHAKILLIDSQWAAVGTTNLDPRSFTLNDEVNLATPDPDVAQRLELDFAQDLTQSREVRYDEWRKRGFAERLHEMFGGFFESQQ